MLTFDRLDKGCDIDIPLAGDFHLHSPVCHAPRHTQGGSERCVQSKDPQQVVEGQGGLILIDPGRAVILLDDEFPLDDDDLFSLDFDDSDEDDDEFDFDFNDDDDDDDFDFDFDDDD